MGNAKYKQKHKELGLCVDCSRPALKDTNLCWLHEMKQNKRTNSYYYENLDKVKAKRNIKYQGRKDRHECPDCGRPLTEEDGVYCVNCIMNKHGGLY